MIITKTCNTCKNYPNDKHCIGCEWDKSKGENSKWELKENPIVIERKVLKQIRAEILNWEDEPECDDDLYQIGAKDMQKYVLAIIDKYKAESEDKG